MGYFDAKGDKGALTVSDADERHVSPLSLHHPPIAQFLGGRGPFRALLYKGAVLYGGTQKGTLILENDPGIEMTGPPPKKKILKATYSSRVSYHPGLA